VNNEKLYKMVRNYAKSQMKKSEIVASHYDWEDIAQKVFLRYHKCGYEAVYPATYMYLMVRSEIYNQYQKDRLRDYNNRQQNKIKYNANSDFGDTWISEKEEDWNDSLLCAGPEELLDYRERIEWIQNKAEESTAYTVDNIYDMAAGESKAFTIKKVPVQRNAFYRAIGKLKSQYSEQFECADR